MITNKRVCPIVSSNADSFDWEKIPFELKVLLMILIKIINAKGKVLQAAHFKDKLKPESVFK